MPHNILHEPTSDVFDHPELQSGEVFFTNADEEGFQSIVFKSKRRGVQPYNGEGTKLSTENWFPIFIQASELAEANTSLIQARRKYRAERSEI
jgi:hypothetical protein